MKSTDADSLVYNRRMSTVVPGAITGDDKVRHLSNADVAMKLHYIRGVYLFTSEAVGGISNGDLKDTMFPLLEAYYPVAGRIRNSPEDGRPFIKCNDSGVRIIEANCSRTVDEWMGLMTDPSSSDSYSRLLYHDQVLGPDLGFSPLLFIQFTWFKCGGVSVGLSWAHVLGDVCSVSEFFNKFAQGLAGRPIQPLQIPTTAGLSPTLKGNNQLPSSFGKVDPVGDHWRIAHSSKMVTHSFQVTNEQLNQLISKSFEGSKHHPIKIISSFDVISAVIWKTLAKLRGEDEQQERLKTVTLIRNDFHDRENEQPSNAQLISVIKAEILKVAEADLLELAKLIAEKGEDETRIIEEFKDVGENGKSSEFFVYGANLTFVNLEGVKVHGFDMNGKKPIYANYSIDGVGEEGAVLVLPEDLSGGRIVNVILPEHLVGELSNELSTEWGVFQK
ncbi:unnamed protein product [Cuscuta epithymum]|uniref:Uncharacterized protein n=1 Tax=Cuscuta epithymum TaxID=186058 RepID=A0AAV0C396_9ASTE|nr:unnamed protein product [Cuscuta epithymum]